MEQGSQKRGGKFARTTVGVSFLTVGVAGCILPVIPGIPFLLGGLSLLAVDHAWAARLRDRMKETATKQMDRIRGKKKEESKPEEAVRIP